jgi:dipeptidyl aminopeptidase/acylaminoacyl peptidase
MTNGEVRMRSRRRGCRWGGVLVCVLLGMGSARQTADAPYTQRQDVVYGEVHGTGLLMDVFVPTGPANGLAIIDVVSGAWHSDRGKIRDHVRARMFDIHCARGYTVFAVRPGSRTRYTLAEMDQHVKTAIRFVKAHAADYGVDPDRIGLTGASAGGHLATLAALTPLPASPDARDVLARHDTTVRAVGVFFPPTDFLDWRNGEMADRSLLAALLSPAGASPGDEDDLRARARAVSPRHHVGRGTVPFLLIHGDADPMVPIEQSRRFVAALKEAGTPADLIVKPGGAHPWPTMPEEVAVLADWFDTHLRKE